MRGDLKVLKTYTGEAVYNKLAAEVRERKKEGIIFDDNVLGIEHCDVHACQVREKRIRMWREMGLWSNADILIMS